MTASLSLASATSILPCFHLSESGVTAKPVPVYRSVEDIKQSSAPQRKFFVAKRTKPNPQQPAASIRQQTGHHYRGGSLFEALVELVWPHQLNTPLTQEQRDQYVDQLADDERDVFVQTFNQRLETACQSINHFLCHVEATTVTRPYQADYQSIDQTNNQAIRQILSYPCDLTSVLSPLLYQLGFLRQSLDMFRLVQPTYQLQSNIDQVRQQLIDSMDEGFEFESNKANDAADDDDIQQSTHAFDVLTLAHDDESESDDFESINRRASVNENNQSSSPRSPSRARSAHKPIRSMPRRPTDVIHTRHTFVSKPGVNQQPNKPVQPVISSSQPISQSIIAPMTYSPALLVDVAGVRRQNPVILPSSFISSAQTLRNDSYLAAELSGQARPVIKTSSTAKQSTNQSAIPFTTFTLQPSTIEFGLVEQGQVYRAQLALTNVGIVKGRFSIREIQQSASFSLRVLCRPGLLAPGLQKRIEIELEPHVVDDAEGFDIDSCLEIATEAAILRVPIHAQAMHHSLFEQKLSEARRLGAPAPNRVTQEATGFFKASGLIGPLKQVNSKIGAIRKMPKSQLQPTTSSPTAAAIIIDVSEAKEQINSLMDEDWSM